MEGPVFINLQILMAKKDRKQRKLSDGDSEAHLRQTMNVNDFNLYLCCLQCCNVIHPGTACCKVPDEPTQLTSLKSIENPSVFWAIS